MVLRTHSCDCVATEVKGHGTICNRVADRSGYPICPFERRSLLDELVAKGVRLTAQRRVLIEIIQTARRHLDAALLLELAQEREPNIDRATVYRTIGLLKKLRLIDELDLMHLEGEKHYYEAKTRRDHVHLACFQCGRIEEFSSAMFERLKREISNQAGFEVGLTRFEVGGRCRLCRNDIAIANKIEEVSSAASNH